MAYKIKYQISREDENAFIDTFRDQWSEEQLMAVQGGSRSPTFYIDPSTLPDPDTINPRTDPEIARKVILTPKSSLRVAERPFVLPLVEFLNTAKKNIPPEIQILNKQYDIYLIKYGVDAKPVGKEKFSELELQMDYPNDQGFQTYSIIPDTEIEERFSARTDVTVGLDPNLKFKVPDINLGQGFALGGDVHLSTESEFILHWNYKLLSAKVVAVGIRSSYVEWTIKKPNQMIGSVELSTVLCVPKSIKKLPIEVTGYYRLERGILWWQRETQMNISSMKPIIINLP